MVKDIWVGGDGYPQMLTNVNGTLYFRARDNTFGQELWKSDGTTAGTVRVKDLNPGMGCSCPVNLTQVNGLLYFTAFEDNSTNYKLHRSDGTATGTFKLRDMGIPFSTQPQYATGFNGSLLFSGNDVGASGNEPWKSDGTVAGTVMIKDIVTGIGSSNVSNLMAVGNSLYFVANDGLAGAELWKTDGTTAGTVLIKDIIAGINSSSPSNLTNVNGILYFTADDGINGKEIWASNGTAAGTMLVQDMNASSMASDPNYLTWSGSNLFFVALDSYGTAQLFVGTTSIALPLTLLALNGRAGEEDVHLNWTTSQEQNTDRFEIERSGNGRDFAYAGTVVAAGNSNSLQGYAFVDRGIVKNNVPVLYYRLKMADRDDHFTWSRILKIYPAASSMTTKIYPNPVKDNATVAYTSSQQTRLLYKLSDHSGKLIKTKTVVLQTGSGTFSVNMQALPAGMYVLTLQVGNKMEQLNILKQ